MKMTSLLRILLILSLTLMVPGLAVAQGYKTGIGLRLSGWNTGISFKQSIGEPRAIEGLFSFRRGGFVVTGLYEKHTSFPNAEGLSWFYGGGAHVGFYDDGYDYYYYSYRNNKVYVYKDNGSATVGLGLDFILGLAYKFKNAPIDLSLDAKPFADFVDGFQGYWDGALTLRFTM
jgi:hypothetical protein